MKRLLVAVAFLLPVGRLRRGLLRLLGCSIHPTARVGMNLVWGLDALTLGPGSHLGSFNLIRHLRRIEVDEAGFIGGHNIITAHPVFSRHMPEAACVVVGSHGVITSRHSIDCSGGLFVGDLACIAGHRSTILSHSVDLERVVQSALPVRLHRHSFASTNVILLGGAELPEKSCLIAGSVLSKSLADQGPGLYGGTPPRRIADFEVPWFERDHTDITDIYVPDRDVTIKDAFAPPRLSRRDVRR